MMVRHKRNGRVAEVLSQDDKLVRVRFIQEGVEQNMTVSTFKRWYKKIDDEDVAGDETPLAEVGKEIAEQAKQKSEQAAEVKTDKVQDAVKKVLKTADPEKAREAKKKAKEKKPREKFDVGAKVQEIKELIKDTDYDVTGYYEKKGIVLKHNSIRGLSIRIYIGVEKMIFELTDKQVLNGVKPDRIRNLRYSKAYDIDYSKQEKLVEYLNKVTYTKSKKGEK